MERQITDTNVQTEKKLTKTDLNKCFLLWHLLGEATLSYERLQTPGVLGCLGPVLKRLYGDDKEEFVNACQRHMEFFNTAGYYGGSIIMGLVCSLEEERANGLPIEGEDISAIKTGLMGPLAGVFDDLRQGTAIPIVASIAIGMGMDGNFFGPIFYMIVTVLYVMVPCYWMFQTSYKKGKEAVNGLFASGKLERFMTLATAVGAITLGGLEATTVTVTSSTVLHLGSSDMVLQETIFDAIFKGLLPVGFVFLSYFLLQKKLSTSKIILILIAIAIVGVLIGFF